MLNEILEILQSNTSTAQKAVLIDNLCTSLVSEAYENGKFQVIRELEKAGKIPLISAHQMLTENEENCKL